MTLQEAIEEVKNKPLHMMNNEALVVLLAAVIKGNLIPADSVFQIREGYYGRMYKHSDNPALMYVTTVPLSEALEIRSADDVRREGYAEGYKDGFKKSGWSEMIQQEVLDRALAAYKGGDDE